MKIRFPTSDLRPQASTIPKPLKHVVPLADGLRWRGGGGFLYTRKYDGVFKTLEIGSQKSEARHPSSDLRPPTSDLCLPSSVFRLPSSVFRLPSSVLRPPSSVLIGELIRPKSGALLTASDRALLDQHGQFFAAHDVATVDGQDVRRASRRERWRILRELSVFSFQFSAFPLVVLADSGHGGEFLQAVLAAGGEGVCATHLDAPYGEMHACKREETFDLVITEMDTARGSIRLGKVETRKADFRFSEFQLSAFSDLGWCPARAAFQNLKIGDVVEIAAMGLTATGKLREARFVRARPDKNLTAVGGLTADGRR